jgi:uncharacterized protein (TIGR02452 family)
MKRDREALRRIAAETITISESGNYSIPGVVEPFDIAQKVRDSIANTAVFAAEKAERDFYEAAFSGNQNRKPDIVVVPLTTLDAAQALTEKTGRAACVLNFASAKHPGGGFENGALAQEEDLCFRSTLYSALALQKDYYAESIRNLRDGLYFNKAIFTRGAVVIRDASYNLCAPWIFHCVTAPAPNRGAAIKNGISEAIVEQAMAERIDLVLNTMATKEQRDIVLGAFGCGVFRNKPDRVATMFHKALRGRGLGAAFSNIMFAIPGEATKNHIAFKAVFHDL